MPSHRRAGTQTALVGEKDSHTPLGVSLPYKKGKLTNLPTKNRILLYNAQMKKANLAHSDLSGAVLIGSDLWGANLGCDPPDSKDESRCSDLS